MHERLTTTSYRGVENSSPYQKIPLSLQNKNTDLMRQYAKYPFVPSNENERMQRCNEIITIQATGLAKRLQHTGISKTVIGIS
jgi:NAD+ synthase (glutamine-hydrolysing)